MTYPYDLYSGVVTDPLQKTALNIGLYKGNGNTYQPANITTAYGIKTPIKVDGVNYYVGSNSPWTSDLSSVKDFSKSLQNYDPGERYGLGVSTGNESWGDFLDRWGIRSDGSGGGSGGLGIGDWNWNGILGGVQTLGGLALGGLQAYTNLSALNAQKDALRWQKDIAYNNLNNSIQSYNNRLTDIMQARAAMETGDKNAYDDQIAERSLQRNGE